ncbi:MAG TPA: hypothetical protein DHW22_13960 [Planctomycetaceae bacterium]|nr:hypothetical protein [Planctomycetaceae bacterium]
MDRSSFGSRPSTEQHAGTFAMARYKKRRGRHARSSSAPSAKSLQNSQTQSSLSMASVSPVTSRKLRLEPLEDRRLLACEWPAVRAQ